MIYCTPCNVHIWVAGLRRCTTRASVSIIRYTKRQSQNMTSSSPTHPTAQVNHTFINRLPPFRYIQQKGDVTHLVNRLPRHLFVVYPVKKKTAANEKHQSGATFNSIRDVYCYPYAEDKCPIMLKESRGLKGTEALLPGLTHTPKTSALS